jgi:hypothetical protein
MRAVDAVRDNAPSLLVAVGVFVLSQMTIVIQIATFKVLAEPRLSLDIVRSQISLLADIQGVEVRALPRRSLRFILICSYQIISSGLILAGGRWRNQWIRWRGLRITDHIVPLGRVLLSGRALRIRCAREKQCGTC